MDFDTNVQLPTPRSRRSDNSCLINAMPFGASKLFSEWNGAQAFAMSLDYYGFKCARRKRSLEIDGEEGWRVWKLEAKERCSQS